MTDESNEQRSQERGNIVRMVFDASLAFIVAATGYYVSGIATELKDLKLVDTELRGQISAVRERQPIDYVRKEEYRSDIVEIKRLLENIDRKVDRKQDRPIERVGPGVYRDGRDINR